MVIRFQQTTFLLRQQYWGFIPSLRTRFYCAKIVKRLLNALPGGDKPLPYVSCNVIDYFELCAIAHWAESRTLR